MNQSLALSKSQFNGFFFFFSSVFDFTVSCSVAWMYDDTFYIPSFLKVLKASCGLRRTDRRISVSVLSVG